MDNHDHAGAVTLMTHTVSTPLRVSQVALIFAQPRGATVKAVGPLQLLSLDRRTFKRVMGPMETILKRNMKAYKRIAASNI